MELLSRRSRCSSAGKCGIVMGSERQACCQFGGAASIAVATFIVPSRSDFMPFIIENSMRNNSTCPNLKSRFHLKIPRRHSNLAVYQIVNCCIKMIRIFRLKANFVVVKWRYYVHITYLEKNSEKKFLLNG